MIDLVSSAFGTMILLGLMVLYSLFNRQHTPAERMLRRYFALTLLAWLVVMLVESVYFLAVAWQEQIPQLAWFSQGGWYRERKLIFRPLEAVAVWSLVFAILRPAATSAQPVAVAQVVMNWRGVIVSWNTEATRLLGWTEDDAVGQLLAELIIPEDLMLGGVPGRQAHAEGLRRFRETGESPIMNTRFPTLALRKEGDHTVTIPIDVMVSAHISDRGTRFLGSMFPRPLLG